MTQPRDEIGILRILDANANRASEGLRVVEEYARFVLDDRLLTGEVKELRHQLAEAIAVFSPAERLAARDTQADVGTQIGTASEYSRHDSLAVVVANFRRVEQSLRSLEEYGKVLAPDAGRQFETLRYRTYSLEKALATTTASRDRLAGKTLYALVDGRESEEHFVELVRQLIRGGVHLFQLRDKTLDDRQLLGRARLLRRETQMADTLFVMNDRADLAVLSHADGVHVGQEELSLKDVRTVVGPDMLIGVSTHTLSQAKQAVFDGANYIGVGPTFPSQTKTFDHFPGLAFLRAVSAEIRLPAFAIGGISRENLAEVIATGIARVAVSGALVNSSDPEQATREFLAALAISKL